MKSKVIVLNKAVRVARYTDERVWKLGGKCSVHSFGTLAVKAVSQQEGMLRGGDIIQLMPKVQDSTE